MVHLVPYEEDFSEYAVPKLPITKDDFSVDNWVDNDSAKIGVINNLSSFFDDFSGADNWVDVGTKVRVNTGTDVIDWDCRRDGTDQHTSFDLQSIIPNIVNVNNWMLRWKCTISTATAGGTASQYTVLLSNSDTLGSESAQDHVTFTIQLSPSGDRLANLFVDAGSQIYTGDSDSLGTNLVGAGSTFYCELTRGGSTYTSTIYSDSGFTTVLGQASLVNTDNLISLRYIKVTNRTATSTTGSYTGTMDDVEFFGDSALSFNFVKDGSTDTSTRDLKFVSDSRWILRFNLIVNTLTNPSIGTSFGIIGISNKTTTGNENFIGMMIVRNSVGIGSYRALSTSNGLPISGVDSSIFTTVPTTSDNYFIEIKRESKNSARMTIFSDSAYTVIVESKVFTTVGGGAPINQNIKDLRYIKLQNVIDTGIGGGSIAGTIDNLLFVNGQLGVTFQDDFATSTNWTSTDEIGDTSATITGGKLVFKEITPDGTNVGIVHDLIIPASNTNWKLRAKLTFTQQALRTVNDARMNIGLFDEDQTSSGRNNQDGIYFIFGASTTYFIATGDVETGGAQPPSGQNNGLFTRQWGLETLYLELERTSLTTYIGRIFSDSAYTNLVEQQVGTMATTLNNLRYIKIQNDGDPATDATSTLVCEIDNIEFFNGQGITFQDDFSSYATQGSADTAYPTTDITKVRVNITTDKIDWVEIQDNTDDTIYHDIGGVINDINWELRFKLDITTATFTSGNNHYFVIGISDNTSNWVNSSDGIVFWFRAGATNPFIRLASTDGAGITGVPNNIQLATTTAVSIRYIKLIRISSTLAKLQIFSNASYSDLIEQAELTIPSGITNLRYIKIGTTQNTSDGLTMASGTIDEIEFYNGMPSRPLLPKTTDTFQEDFSSGTSWTTSNVPNINVGSGVINFNLTQNASNATIARDLSSGFVDATKWLLRFKINFSSITDQAEAIIGLSSTDQTVNFGTGAQDSLQVEFSALTGANTIHLFYNAGVGRISAGSISLDYTTGTDYYVELIRTENTKATLHIYSNSNFTELIGSLNNITIGSGVSLLRYIKIGNVSSSIDTGNHTGTIDNIEFFNGVSVANTVKRSIPDLEFDFSDSIGWVQTSTGVVVDTVDQRIEGWANDGSDRRVTFDMGSSGILSEQNWTIEFEYEFSASSLPAHGIFTISDVNLDVWFSPAPTVDAIGIFHGTSIDQLVISYKDGSGGNILSTDVIPISFNTRYYVRLERIKNTILKLSVFSDPDFTKHVTSSPIFLTTLSTIANLRYLRSGNASQGSVLRTLTGFLRNLKVYRTVRGTDKDNKYLVIG